MPRLGEDCPGSNRGPLRRPGPPSCSGRSARSVQAQQERLNVRPQSGDEVLCAKGASASGSDGGTRLSFPSINQGREVFQPNAGAGLCHERVSLRARLRGPCLAECRSSRAPPPCSSRPFLPISALFMTTRIACMAYLPSLTGMRRLAFVDARPALMASLTERRRRSPSATGLRPRQTNQRPGLSMCIPSSSSRSAIVGTARDDHDRGCGVNHFRRESRS
jgi:hypothetical protein